MKNGGSVPTIECEVWPGMFSDERGIQFRLPDGREVSAFVDRSQVVTAEDPRPGRAVRGRLKVTLVEKRGGVLVIDMPQPGFSAGPRLEVPASFVGEVSARDFE